MCLHTLESIFTKKMQKIISEICQARRLRRLGHLSCTKDFKICNEYIAWPIFCIFLSVFLPFIQKSGNLPWKRCVKISRFYYFWKSLKDMYNAAIVYYCFNAASFAVHLLVCEDAGYMFAHGSTMILFKCTPLDRWSS